ncbi:DUF2474 family protein [Sphingopyxis sp.]|nr:DUF2474 family protein [Sphingopyxis sp.]MBW8294451.1 DUF2474 family protein [Sphingopyxis sp.]
MPKSAKQLLWLITIWVMSVGALGIVASIIRYWIK